MNESLNNHITVLMPVFNASLYLKEAIESVLNQTYSDFEFIIINDGSTDNSFQIIESYKDKRIKIINNKVNLGIIESRNIGLRAAKCKYIANMDADDICLPTRFEKQVEYLNAHPDVAVLATKLILIDPSGEELGVWPEDNSCVTEEEILKTLPVINCIGQPTSMMRADLIRKIEYNKKFIHNEDWGLWLHVLSLNLRIAKLPEVLLKYRQHPKSTTVSANTLGVEKKILSFKFKYLKYKIGQGKFRYTDKQVFLSFLKEIFRFSFKKIFPRFYVFGSRVKKLEKKRYLTQFFKVRKLVKAIAGATDHIYFFPFFHTGGAERVHASILEAANQKRSVVFITSKSDNFAFYDLFSRYATVIEIDELIKLGFSERWLIKKISHLLPDSSDSTVLGCNSLFFYQVISTLPPNVKVIDLLHAFVHDYEGGPEKWSLPYITRLNNRIVINEKTKKDFRELYRKNNIPENYLSRISVIPNFVETQDVLPVKDPNVLNVAYVGRDGEEKRVNLIATVAKNCSLLRKNLRFHFVGNVKRAISQNLYDACIFHGEISDEQQLQELYKQFHIIIIASTREGFPMVIMEGMMQGAVPVCTNVGGISEHIEDNVNGFLVNSNNEDDIIKEFVEKIIYLGDNRNALLRLSQNAYTYALKNFNKDKFFKAWNELLNNIQN